MGKRKSGTSGMAPFSIFGTITALFPRKCGKIDLTVDLEPLRVALLVRIADSLDAIREGMAPAGPVLATVAGGYVKCPSCGDLNAQGADVCRACGKAMAA